MLPTITVKERTAHTDSLEKKGYKIIVDPGQVNAVYNRAAYSHDSLTKGFYHFVSEPEAYQYEGTTYWKAKAAYYFQNGDGWFANFDYYNVSHLISKLSLFKDKSETRPAHHIYEWPIPSERSNYQAWVKKKLAFIKSRLIGSYVHVFKSEYITNKQLADQPFYQATWNFINDVDFFNFPAGLQMSDGFAEFLTQKDQYPSINAGAITVASLAAMGFLGDYVEDIPYDEDYFVEDYDDPSFYDPEPDYEDYGDYGEEY